MTRAVKINHSKGLPDLVYRKDPEGAFVKKYDYRGSYGSHSVPLPLIVFPAHFFFSMLFARSTQAKRHGSGRIFYLCNPFRGNVLLQIAALFAAQKLHGSAGRMKRIGGFARCCKKCARESHEMAQNVLNIAYLMAISIFR